MLSNNAKEQSMSKHRLLVLKAEDLDGRVVENESKLIRD